MKQLIRILVMVFSSVAIAVTSLCYAETVQDAYDKAVQGRGASTIHGCGGADGNFILVIADARKEDDTPVPEQYNAIRLKAMQEMAGFLNRSVTGSESADSAMNSAAGKGKNSQEGFRSSITADVRQTLSGVRQLPVVENGGRLFCGVYFSEKALASVPAPTAPADGLVVATGIYTVTKDRLDEAKAQALLQAQRIAVEQVLGVLIAGTDQSQKEHLKTSETKAGSAVAEKTSRSMSHVTSKLFSNTAGFIETYSIVTEGVKGNCYETTIRAKVAKNKLYESYQSLLKVMGDPEFFLDARGDVEMQQKFEEFFGDLGFRMTSARERAAYVLDVTWKFANIVHPIDKTSGTRLSAWVKLIAPETGQVIFTVANEPTRACSFVGDTTTQHDIVVRNAFAQMKKPLHEKVNAAIANMTQNGRVVTVAFKGYTPAKSTDVESAVAVARGVPGVSDVSSRLDADGGVLELRVTYVGRVDDLKDFLLKGFAVHPLSGGVPPVLQVLDNSLILQM